MMFQRSVLAALMVLCARGQVHAQEGPPEAEQVSAPEDADDGAAEESAPEPADSRDAVLREREDAARAAFGRAEAAYEAENYEEALEGFLESYDQLRLPELLYNIGAAHDRLGHAREAITNYQAYLSAASNPQRVGYIESRVEILQAEVEREDAEREAIAQQNARAEAEARAAEAAAGSLTAPTVILISGLGLGVASLGPGIAALRGRNALRERCDESICDPSEEENARRIDRLAIASDVVLFTGAALAVTGLVWLLVRRKKNQNLTSALSCTPAGCDGSIEVRF